MKKYGLFLMGAAFAIYTHAQSLNVIDGDVTYSFQSMQTGIMEYSDNGRNVTIQGKTFDITGITGIEVIEPSFEDNIVLVEYNGSNVSVTIAGNIAQFITATTDGAHVTINQGSGIGDTTGEVTYILKGESDNGSLVLNGSYKCTIELQGLSLTNPSGSVIDIENGKRIELSSKNGTINTLIDGVSGSQKGAIYCKGHLELKGKGVLNVTGNKSHAIASKEYIEMKNVTLNILGAVKDGINCAQYFQIESGELNISGTGDDGIQCDFKDAKGEREDDDTATITIKGGKVNISVTATATKCLKAEGDFVMKDGDLTLHTSGAGDWDSSKLKTKASSCIGIDGTVLIEDGTMVLTATGGGGKGISCDGTLTINGGNINITTSGGVLAYVNGSLNQNYTGNTDRLDSDYKSSPKGIKGDDDIIINGGIINIKTTGNGGEGIESKAQLTINDGKITVRAKDDAINSSSHMYIKGGEIEVISTGNDGLDSNGNLYISGGIVKAFGAKAPECGLDANEEEGYTVYFTGGYILAAGGNNSVPQKTGSTQPYITTNVTLSAGSTVSIGTSSETYYTFDIPSDYTSTSGGNGGGPGGRPGGNSGGGVLISVPQMTSGSTYTIKSGNSTSTATARLTR